VPALPRVHQQKDSLAGEMTRQRKAIQAAITDVDRMLETPFTSARAELLTVTRELAAMRDLKAALEPVSMTLANINVPGGVEISMVNLALEIPQSASHQPAPMLAAKKGKLISVMLFGETGCVLVKSPIAATVEVRLWPCSPPKILTSRRCQCPPRSSLQGWLCCGLVLVWFTTPSEQQS